MNANELKTVVVGDVVVLVREFGADPESVNVSRLSKKWFWVIDRNGKEVGGFDLSPRTNPDWFDRDESGSEPSKDYKSYERAGATKYDLLKNARVYPLSLLSMLIARHEIDRNGKEVRVKAEKEAKAAEAKARREERANEEAARFAETKAAYGGSLFGHIRAKDTMLDGTRIYHVTCVVKPEHSERKHGWEMAIVKCREIEDWDFRGDSMEKVKVMESHITYTNGNESSFPSVSGDRHSSDEDALWAAVNYIYHHW